MRRAGRCLCGAVTITAEVSGNVQACHCRQCQQWTGGGPYLAAEVADLDIAGGENTRSFQASAWGERVNCATCGAILWWKMQDKPARSVAVGLLDDQSDLSVTEEIFVDFRPTWLSPVEGAAQSTEAEEQAKLAAYLSRKTETDA